MNKKNNKYLIYGYGQNKFSQFGPNIPTSSNLLRPEVILNSSKTTLDGSPIVQITCTSFGSFYVTEKGNVFSSGLNFMRKPHSHFHNYSIAVPSLRNNVKQISSGANHAVLITRDNQVYSVGDGYFGLGHQDCCYLTTFTKIDSSLYFDSDVIFEQVKCGQSHTLLLTKCGKVYGFGCSSFGQLCVKNKRVPTPKQITINSQHNRMISIDAGSDFSVMIDETNTAYFMGNNSNGQSGVTSYNMQPLIIEPIQIAQLENNVKSVSAGYSNLAILTLDNQLYTTGVNSHNLLMREDSDQLTLARVDTSAFGTITRIVYNSLILSAFFVNDRNDVYGIGDLTLLNTSDHVIDLDMKIPLDCSIDFATGAKHVFIYTTPVKPIDRSWQLKKNLFNCHYYCDIAVVSV
jgi:alpha-tubulin suppressor-like RCC1 family protein